MSTSQYIELSDVRERLTENGFELFRKLATTAEIALYGRYSADFTEDHPLGELIEIPDGFVASCQWEAERSRLFRDNEVFPGSFEQQHEHYTDVKVNTFDFEQHFDTGIYDAVLSKRRGRGRPDSYNWAELTILYTEILDAQTTLSMNKAGHRLIELLESKNQPAPSPGRIKEKLGAIYRSRHFDGR